VSRSIGVTAAVTLIAALAIAGCGGSNDSSGSGGAYGGKGGGTTQPASTPAAEAPGGAVIVSAARNSKLGTIIVDFRGRTLYDFHKDKGTTSSCYGGCAGVWPPLVTDGAPKAGNGASASKLGTTKRDDGTVQVTYAGHPLYTYTADTKPGDVRGNDIDSFGAEWYALTPQGTEP
jgi:predicted lipoprotein with Yx(FWY)xxD motif